MTRVIAQLLSQAGLATLVPNPITLTCLKPLGYPQSLG